jgi:hypothetical protein
VWSDSKVRSRPSLDRFRAVNWKGAGGGVKRRHASEQESALGFHCDRGRGLERRVGDSCQGGGLRHMPRSARRCSDSPPSLCLAAVMKEGVRVSRRAQGLPSAGKSCRIGPQYRSIPECLSHHLE